MTPAAVESSLRCKTLQIAGEAAITVLMVSYGCVKLAGTHRRTKLRATAANAAVVLSTGLKRANCRSMWLPFARWMNDVASVPLLSYVGPGAGMTFLGSFLVLAVAGLLLFFSLLTWPFRFLLAWCRRILRGEKWETHRVVVLGLDGLDPARVRRLMDAGMLPHLQQLAKTGIFRELRTTLPPISPVAWSSFQTGVHPGKHRIFDFVNRDLKSYLPEMSSVRITGSDADRTGVLGRIFSARGGSIQMLRRSQPFWKILGDHGVFSTILRIPVSFPPEKFNGLSLSAMCTPDLRGTQGTFTWFTTDPEQMEQPSGGLSIAIVREGNRIMTSLPGPPNPRGIPGSAFSVPLEIDILPGQKAVRLCVNRQRILLPLQQDSGWIRVVFRCGRLTRVRAICRFRLESLEPHLQLYVSPIHLDPERPAMPISHPRYYSMYLAGLHDAFATLGLAEDTWALNAGRISEAAFLEQAYVIHSEREAMFLDALRRMPRGLTVCVFDAPDRIQHMFYRHDDPHHPANRDRDVRQHATVLDDMYQRMDQLVGRTMQELDAQSVLMVISDHGFCNFRRGVNLNAWLRDNGYLTLLPDAVAGDYLCGVDWSKTRAYAFGLSGIYLNKLGRESGGIVPPEECGALRAEMAGRLTELIDEENGARAVHAVHDSHTAYSGPYATDGPDLIVGYARGYRASWENAAGRTDGPVFSDNTRYWSGDHCVDPALVPGVFFSNCRWQSTDPSITDPSITDLAPTILKLFGIRAPGYMDGRALVREPNQLRAGRDGGGNAGKG